MVDLDKAIESAKTIKLSGGIFGKTTQLLIVLCIGVSVVCYKTEIWWFSLILMLPLMVIIFYALKRSYDFAEKNPHAAVMDGAELLVHERIVQGRKGQETLPSFPPTLDHQMPTFQLEDLESTDPSPPLSNGNTLSDRGAE